LLFTFNSLISLVPLDTINSSFLNTIGVNSNGLPAIALIFLLSLIFSKVKLGAASFKSLSYLRLGLLDLLCPLLIAATLVTVFILLFSSLLRTTL